MNDREFAPAASGWTNLYHPRGPQVSLAVTGDTPKAMFDYVTAMLDAGFVVTVPGLEVGELKEDVGWVARSTHEGRTGLADVIAYYSTNEGWTKPFLTDYLNNDEDRREFSAATGINPASIPEYIGEGRLERGKNPKTDALIIKLPRPKTLIMKPNPKWIQTEYDAAIASGKVYKVPKRVFVRWAEAPPPSQPPGDGTPPLTDMQVAESAWKARLAGVLAVDDLNKQIPLVKAITDVPIRSRAWAMCLELANSRKWVLDKAAEVFRHTAEMPKTAAPPPDESPDSPLIAAWKKKLDPEIVNEAKLNGELLASFKSIGKTEADRQTVWDMLTTFASENECPWNGSRFVEVANAGMPDYPG